MYRTLGKDDGCAVDGQRCSTQVQRSVGEGEITYRLAGCQLAGIGRRYDRDIIGGTGNPIRGPVACRTPGSGQATVPGVRSLGMEGAK